MIKKVFRNNLAFLILSLLPLLGYSQKPLKVGLVLSGGGAKGYAHIGALKVLEEAGIRVDYIGGASIGAIVGGLYAAGWTASELDSLVRDTDIGATLQDKILRRTKSFFEKEYGEHYALSLGFKDFQVQIPPALSNGQDIYNLLSQWTNHVNGINDFSQLPIPFLATGTDVVTGEEILFTEGFLPHVMRASSSFPGLLAPVWINDRLVTDGGLVNNFPVKEVKNQGMDIIIGINVGEGLYKEKDLQSVSNIITQISSFQMVKRTEEQMQYCDLVIHPDIKAFGVTSFDALDTLMKNGEKAAYAVWDQLVDIANRQAAAAESPPAVQTAASDTFCIDTLIISDLPGYSKNNILKSFPVPLEGKVCYTDFYMGIENLYGKGYFQAINFQFSQSTRLCHNVAIDARLKPGYNRLLRLGLHYDNIYKSSLLLNLTFRNLGFKNSTASVDLILGDQFRYNFNYFVEKTPKIDIGINSYLRHNDFNFELPQPVLLSNGFLLTELDFKFIDFSNEFYIHLWRNKNYAIGLAAEVKYQKVSTQQLIPLDSDQPIISGKGFSLVGSTFFKLDNRNQRHFPSSGINLRLFGRLYTPVSSGLSESNLNYNLDFHLQNVFRISGRFCLGITADAGLSFGESSLPYFYFLGSTNQNLINNFKPFIGLPFAKGIGSDLYGASIYGQQRIFKNHYATLTGQGAYLKSIFDTEGSDWLPFYSIGLGYGINTPLGPIELIYGLSNETSTLNFNLGYWF